MRRLRRKQAPRRARPRNQGNAAYFQDLGIVEFEYEPLYREEPSEGPETIDCISCSEAVGEVDDGGRTLLYEGTETLDDGTYRCDACGIDAMLEQQRRVLNEALRAQARSQASGATRSDGLRACVVCGRPSKDGYCPDHRPRPWANSKRRQRMGLSGGAWDTVRQKVLSRDRGASICATSSAPARLTIWSKSPPAAPTTSTTSRRATQAATSEGTVTPKWAQERVEMALAVLGRAA
jgi:hypothetical protein